MLVELGRMKPTSDSKSISREVGIAVKVWERAREDEKSGPSKLSDQFGHWALVRVCLSRVANAMRNKKQK